MENEILELKELIRNFTLEKLSEVLNYEKTDNPLQNHLKITCIIGEVAKFCKSSPFIEKMQSVMNITSNQIEDIVDQVHGEIIHELY
ncbi:hypothetical protein [Flavipsychrobacter stenotrophus]|nr:hypothetical protein [Flavipsychrobacter stenotrophus]